MLHAGLSLEVFKKWAPNPKNLCILPGYCVVGTVGNKLVSGRAPERVEIDRNTTVEVRCGVRNAKGILQMIRQVEPRNVMLVHGEKEKMAFLKQKIIDQFHIPVYDPPNWTSVTMHGNDDIPVTISSSLLKRAFEESALETKKQKGPITHVNVSGVLLMNTGQSEVRLLPPEEAVEELGFVRHQLSLVNNIHLPPALQAKEQLLSQLAGVLASFGTFAVEPALSRPEPTTLKVSWSYADDPMAVQIVQLVEASFSGGLM